MHNMNSDSCTYRGALIEKDIDKAVRLFELSGKYGCGEAQVVLGQLYKEGVEVTQNLEEAARLFRDAAYLGENKFGKFDWGFFKCKDLESRELLKKECGH